MAADAAPDRIVCRSQPCRRRSRGRPQISERKTSRPADIETERASDPAALAGRRCRSVGGVEFGFRSHCVARAAQSHDAGRGARRHTSLRCALRCARLRPVGCRNASRRRADRPLRASTRARGRSSDDAMRGDRVAASALRMAAQLQPEVAHAALIDGFDSIQPSEVFAWTAAANLPSVAKHPVQDRHAANGFARFRSSRACGRTSAAPTCRLFDSAASVALVELRRISTFACGAPIVAACGTRDPRAREPREAHHTLNATARPRETAPCCRSRHRARAMQARA